jgi:hypothetical protein
MDRDHPPGPPGRYGWAETDDGSYWTLTVTSDGDALALALADVARGVKPRIAAAYWGVSRTRLSRHALIAKAQIRRNEAHMRTVERLGFRWNLPLARLVNDPDAGAVTTRLRAPRTTRRISRGVRVTCTTRMASPPGEDSEPPRLASWPRTHRDGSGLLRLRSGTLAQRCVIAAQGNDVTVEVAS